MTGPRPPRPLPEALRDDFARFWAAYPTRRPNPRRVAEAAWLRVVQGGVAPAVLTQAAAAYAAECKAKGLDEAFIVHARTFLTQARYEDYAAPEAATSAAAPSPEPEHPLWPALRPHMRAAEFRAWIAPLTVAAWEPGQRLHLVAPNRFLRAWVRDHYVPRLRTGLGVSEVSIDIAGAAR